MKSLICTGGIALAFALASITGAEAQKKMTYQEAFAKCKQEIGASASSSECLRDRQREGVRLSARRISANSANWVAGLPATFGR